MWHRPDTTPTVASTYKLPKTRGQTALFQSRGRPLRHRDRTGNITWQLMDMTHNGQWESMIRRLAAQQRKLSALKNLLSPPGRGSCLVSANARRSSRRGLPGDPHSTITTGRAAFVVSPGSFSGVRRAMGWCHGLATLSRKGRRAPPATLSVRKPRQGPRRFLKHADISTKTVEVLVCLAVGRSTIRIGSGPGMPEYRRRTPQRSPGPVSGYESMPTVIACPWPYAG